MPDAEAVLFHGSFVTGEGYARRAANAFMLFQLRRPGVWVQIVLPLLLIPVLGLTLTKYPWSIPIALAVDVLLVVANLVSWISKRRSLANRMAASAVPGSIREIEMTEDMIALRVGESSSRTPYRQFESAQTQGDFVFLRVRGNSVRSILPRELFTDESLAFFRSKVAG